MRWSLSVILLGCVVLACDSEDGGDEGGDPGSTGADPSGGDPSEAGESEPMSSGDPSGLMCDLYNADDVCTTCVIESCCGVSEACAADAMCLNCFELMNAGDVLGAAEIGCFEHPPYNALSDCINDPSGCGPICSPPAGCGDYTCTYDSDCTTVGCSTCTVDGVCS